MFVSVTREWNVLNNTNGSSTITITSWQETNEMVDGII